MRRARRSVEIVRAVKIVRFSDIAHDFAEADAARDLRFLDLAVKKLLHLKRILYVLYQKIGSGLVRRKHTDAADSEDALPQRAAEIYISYS